MEYQSPLSQMDSLSRSKGVATLFLLYIFSNVYCAYSYFQEGYFDGGDFEGFVVDNLVLLLSLPLVVISYVGLYFLLAAIARSVKDTDSNFEFSSAISGVTIFAIQLVLLWYVANEGAMMPGQVTEPSFITYFHTLFVPDYLFLAFYALGRGSRWFLPNLAVYVTSNLLRGVSGGLALVLFFELIWMVYRRRWLQLCLLLLLVVLVTPLVYELRVLIRTSGALYLAATPVSEIFMTALGRSYASGSILTAYTELAHFLMMRLQHLSSVAMIAQNWDTLAWIDVNGVIAPFFSEGILQQQLFGGLFRDKPVLQELLVLKFLNTELGSWYVHPGLAGWFFINPATFIAQVLYIAALAWLLFYLVKKNGGGRFSIQCASVYVLVFIANGWFGPFNSILHALLLILIIQALSRSARDFIHWFKEILSREPPTYAARN